MERSLVVSRVSGTVGVEADTVSGTQYRIASPLYPPVADPTPRTPSRRADAQRNRDKILAAAHAAFAEPGADVSMAEISRRAGVGMATLYRNFAGRRELLEALYADEVDALCEAAANVDGETPGARLERWLRRFFVYFTSKRHIASELLEHVDG